MPRHDKNQVFRREALEQLDDVGELDRLVTVTRRRAWVALAAVAALIIAALVWASFGRLQSTVSGQGLLLHGGQTHRVTTVDEGRLTKVLVDVGDAVIAGDPIAVVVPAAQLARIQRARAAAARARHERDRILASSPATPAEAAAQQALAAAERALKRARTVAAGRTVTSPYSGVVSSLQTHPGQYVASGAPLVTIEPVEEPLVATLYLPVGDGKKVKVGQDVQIIPTNIPIDKYGYLLGTVTFVADLASTPESMSAVLQNAFLVQQFASAGPVLQVEAALRKSPQASSTYAWSSSDGPSERLSPGTTCTARVVLSEAAPITYAFPALARLFGSTK